MKVGLYKDEWGDSSKYREFECCEINLDNMTPGQNNDYTIEHTGPDVTVDDFTLKAYHVSLTYDGTSKIQNIITDESNLIMSKPFWTWNSETELREWMGGHFTAQPFSEKPRDWETALYWKYYVETVDTSYNAFVQWKTPTLETYNQNLTYYVCDSEEYEPQKIYYGKGDYAPSFVIGQCLHNPPNGISIANVSGTIGGSTYNGYPCGTSLSGSIGGAQRLREFAYKEKDDEYTGYADMISYEDFAMSLHHFPPAEILTNNPAQNKEYKHLWQMAHITYQTKEWIGWGEIKYNYIYPDLIQSSDFTFVPIEIFEGAIDPDPEPEPPAYDGGFPAGNDGTAGHGTGIPQGDPMTPTMLTGGYAGLTDSFRAGIHAYVIDQTNLDRLTSFLWDTTKSIWTRFQNYKFNPIAGIMGLHRIPSILMPQHTTNVPIHLAGISCTEAETGITGGIFADHLDNAFTMTKPNISSLTEPDATFTLNQSNGRAPFKNFMDFAKTHVTLHIPFCGDVNIDADKCIYGKVEVFYQCDVLTGNVGAQVRTTDMYGRTHIVANATGNCAYQIPISGSDTGMGAVVGSVGKVGSSLITSIATGNALPLVMGAAGAVGEIATQKHTTLCTGEMGANAGWTVTRSFKLDVEWASPVDTAGCFEDVNGRPCANDTGKVKDFTGYGEMKVNTDTITGANDIEKDRIRQILETGVII